MRKSTGRSGRVVIIAVIGLFVFNMFLATQDHGSGSVDWIESARDVTTVLVVAVLVAALVALAVLRVRRQKGRPGAE